MKPPICGICGKDFRNDPASGGLVSFKISKKDKKYNEALRIKGTPGHHKGDHWFCSRHIQSAQKYQALTFRQAYLRIKFESGILQSILSWIKQ